jgi:hypothetical protein
MLVFTALLRLSKLRDDNIPNGGACIRAGTTLTGKVVLDLPKSKELRDKLELDLVAEEEIYVNSTRTLREIWKHSVVVRDWSDKKSQSLNKGSYGLPFEIPLPIDLPCSMSCVKGVVMMTSELGGAFKESTKSDQCWVRYRLEARFGPKKRLEKYIGVVPCPIKAVVDIIDKSPQQFKWIDNDTVLVGAKTDRSVYILGDKIRLSLSIRNLGRKPLRRVDVELREFCAWATYADNYLSETTPRYKRCLYTAENVAMKTILDPDPNTDSTPTAGETDGDQKRRREEEEQMTRKLENQTSSTDVIHLELPIYTNARLSGETDLTRVWHSIDINILSRAGCFGGGGGGSVFRIPVQLTL